VEAKFLSAERIADMLTEHHSDGFAGGELKRRLDGAPPPPHHLSLAMLIDLNLGPGDV